MTPWHKHYYPSKYQPGKKYHIPFSVPEVKTTTEIFENEHNTLPTIATTIQNAIEEKTAVTETNLGGFNVNLTEMASESILGMKNTNIQEVFGSNSTAEASNEGSITEFTLDNLLPMSNETTSIINELIPVTNKTTSVIEISNGIDKLIPVLNETTNGIDNIIPVIKESTNINNLMPVESTTGFNNIIPVINESTNSLNNLIPVINESENGMDGLIPVINESTSVFDEIVGEGSGMELITTEKNHLETTMSWINENMHHHKKEEHYKESSTNIVLYVIIGILLAALIIVLILYAVAKYKKKRACHNLYNLSTASEQHTIDQSFDQTLDQTIIDAYKC